MTRALRAVPAAQVTLGDAVDAYLDTLSHAERRGTRKQYGAILGRMARGIGEGRDVQAVTAADLAAWMKATSGDRAPRTWNLARVCLRSAWSWWGQAGWADPEVARGIPPRKVAEDRDWAIPGWVLEELRADQREALRLRVIEGRSYREIAITLDCSEDVVRARVSRGLRCLAAQLDG